MFTERFLWLIIRFISIDDAGQQRSIRLVCKKDTIAHKLLIMYCGTASLPQGI